MDPNEALRQIRQAFVDYDQAESVSAVSAAAAKLRECAGALDEWLTGGGFLPTAWAAGR